MGAGHVETMLPTVAPDLVLGLQPGGRWMVRQLSSGVADEMGLVLDSVLGREVQGLFGGTTPTLGELADEVVSSDRGMVDVPIRLHARAPLLLATVAPGGLGADYSEVLVRFYFQAPRDVDSLVEGQSERFGLVGSSPGMLAVYRKIELYADSDASVLVTGETGTGKELVARALHEQGGRRARPFVAVNCSAVSAELLESELFGHEKGAFTGALREHRGRFERAHGGTIFLDEVGDMPARAQAKLLRVLETGLIERVGAEREVAVDVRVVCATNVPLEAAVGDGRFRSDLYHRIAVLRIHLPPLRKRMEDLPLLVDHFLRMMRSRYGRSVQRLTPDAMTLLDSYLWPGNVRELRNVLERVFVETQAEVIGVRAFAEWVSERQDFSPGDWGGRGDLQAPQQAILAPYESAQEGDARALTHELAPEVSTFRPTTRPRNLSVAVIRNAAAQTGGNLAAAARLLGVHRATLYRYIKKHNLSSEDLSS